jgi:hypothetical protein
MEEQISRLLGTSVVSMKEVPVSSLAKYLPACPELAEAGAVLEVHGADRVLYHFETPTLVVLRGTCQVLFDEVPISQLVEFQFSEDLSTGGWRVAALVEDAVQTYKASAFASWEEQLRKPSCEAAFRRLLQSGPVSKIFDKHIFPTPPEYAEKYQVINEKNGKLIDLPHPVDGLRVWDEPSGSYRAIDATLDGAPRGHAEVDQYFSRQIEELKQEMGDDYIDSLMQVK